MLSVLLCLFFLVSSSSYCNCGPYYSNYARLGPVTLTGYGLSIQDDQTCYPYYGALDYTNEVADVVTGTSYNLDYYIAACDGTTGWQVFTAVWIDWNQNTVFETSEVVYNASLSTPSHPYATFMVPITALPGKTRMRVQVQQGGYYPLNPCAGFNYGGTKDFSVIVRGGAGPYCNAGPFYNTDTNLGSVSLKGQTLLIMDSTDCPGIDGVRNLTNEVADVILGGSYLVSFDVTTCGVQYKTFSAVYIDYNQNFVFDTNELVYNVSGYGIQSVVFVVPDSALKGSTRMRIQTQENAVYPLNPCANFSYGATKDFTISLPSFSYCNCGPTMTTGTTLGPVSLYGDSQSINDPSQTCPNVKGPQDLTKDVADVTRGMGYIATYLVETCDELYFATSAIWIDYNQNFAFESTELVYWSTGYGTQTAKFVIPGEAKTGSTRMRVQVQETSQTVIDPCGMFGYGATKDFSVKIK